ncbi:hypothetical protein ABIB40_000378 [Pedobacter sp. UYP30]
MIKVLGTRFWANRLTSLVYANDIANSVGAMP